MEKYKLGDNIILTTPKRYEEKFKALGYEPYKETKTEKITEKEEEKTEKETRKARKTIKED